MSLVLVLTSASLMCPTATMSRRRRGLLPGADMLRAIWRACGDGVLSYSMWLIGLTRIRRMFVYFGDMAEKCTIFDHVEQAECAARYDRRRKRRRRKSALDLDPLVPGTGIGDGLDSPSPTSLAKAMAVEGPRRTGLTACSGGRPRNRDEDERGSSDGLGAIAWLRALSPSKRHRLVKTFRRSASDFENSRRRRDGTRAERKRSAE